MAFDGNQVVGGPWSLVISATTVGHTKAGVRVMGPQTTYQLRSHESGDAPLKIFPRGGRAIRAEVQTLEITAAMLSLLCHDVSATTHAVAFMSNKHMADNLPEFENVKLIQENVSGVSTALALKKAMCSVDDFLFLGVNEDDSVWQVNAVFRCRYIDSASLAVISQTSIGP